MIRSFMHGNAPCISKKSREHTHTEKRVVFSRYLVLIFRKGFELFPVVEK
jgi:hypothetical protein